MLEEVDQALALHARAKSRFLAAPKWSEISQHALTVCLGNVLALSGRYAEATVQYRETLPVAERIFGRDSSDAAVILGNVGRLAYLRGDFSGALELYRRVSIINDRLGRTRSPTNGDLLTNIGAV